MWYYVPGLQGRVTGSEQDIGWVCIPHHHLESLVRCIFLSSVCDYDTRNAEQITPFLCFTGKIAAQRG